MNVNSKWAVAVVNVFKGGEPYNQINIRRSLFKDVELNSYYRSPLLFL